MIRRTLAAASLLLATGCESDHDHGHDHEATHEQVAAPPAPPSASAATPPATAMGEYEVRLDTSDQGLRLSIVDAKGAPVVPVGEARVVLTGTGQAEQRVVLKPEGDGWAGAAKAVGAPGYIAVLSVELAGSTESARVSWGEVPEVAPAAEAVADEPEDHDEHDEHDHGHGHDH